MRVLDLFHTHTHVQDAYVRSQSKGPMVTRDFATRMSWVFRKSGLAMALTSATTCSAFLVCLNTPLPPTQGFGIFAALVIFFDYILVMTMFCSAVMVYHNRFEKPPACAVRLPTPCGLCTCGCCLEGCDCSASSPTPTDVARTRSQSGEEVKTDHVETFFRTRFAPMIIKPATRILVAFTVIAWLVPAFLFMMKLRPTTKTTQFLKDSHPFQKFLQANSEFGDSAESPGIDIYYIWGIKDLNRNGANVLFDIEYLGDAQFAEDFVLSPQCQEKILQICEDLKLVSMRVNVCSRVSTFSYAHAFSVQFFADCYRRHSIQRHHQTKL